MRNRKNILFLFVLFILLVLGYAGYTARHLILGPQLSLGVPGGVLSTTTQVIEISGVAQNTTELKMNNRQLLLSEDGTFSERMLLAPGTNLFIFDAWDKFGRATQEELRVLYTPKKDDVIQLKETDITNTNE
jgi:hypothetical protein